MGNSRVYMQMVLKPLPLAESLQIAAATLWAVAQVMPYSKSALPGFGQLQVPFIEST